MGVELTIAGFVLSVIGITDSIMQRRKKDKALNLLSGPLHEARGHLMASRSSAASKRRDAIDECVARIDSAIRCVENL
jgi:hypothetical protein